MYLLGTERRDTQEWMGEKWFSLGVELGRPVVWVIDRLVGVIVVETQRDSTSRVFVDFRGDGNGDVTMMGT